MAISCTDGFDLAGYTSVFQLGVGFNILFGPLKDLVFDIRSGHEKQIASLEAILRLSRKRLGEDSFEGAQSKLALARQDLHTQEQSVALIRRCLVIAGVISAFVCAIYLVAAPSFSCVSLLSLLFGNTISLVPFPLFLFIMYRASRDRYSNVISLTSEANALIRPVSG